MNSLLWVLQIILAIAFSYSGIMKSTQSREQLVRIGQTGVDGLPYPLIRFIGVTEMLGVIGIILPMALNISPVLTPITSTCFAVIMALAAPIHYKRKEAQSVLLNICLFVISVFVAYMRFSELMDPQDNWISKMQ
jgi:uncharacterized membrane protein YphA (DoxX/SURF4 family)